MALHDTANDTASYQAGEGREGGNRDINCVDNFIDCHITHIYYAPSQSYRMLEEIVLMYSPIIYLLKSRIMVPT